MRIPILLFGLGIMLQACTEPDTTPPLVDITSLSPAPQTGSVCGQMEDNVVFLNSGDTLEITFELTDDNELSQYKLDLHSNFDCHGHANKTNTTDWYLISIEDLSGATSTVTRQLPVPADVTSGLYHFSIQATDISGNNSITSIYSLQVTNGTDDEAPTLDVSAPSGTGFSVQKGTDVNFSGNLTDNLPLGIGGNGRLELRYWSQVNQTVNTLYTENLASSAQTSYDFNFNATVPITTVSGTYIFELRGFDGVNNPSNAVQFTVEIF